MPDKKTTKDGQETGNNTQQSVPLIWVLIVGGLLVLALLWAMNRTPAPVSSVPEPTAQSEVAEEDGGNAEPTAMPQATLAPTVETVVEPANPAGNTSEVLLSNEVGETRVEGLPAVFGEGELCPADGSVTLVYPGYSNPNVVVRHGVGFAEGYQSVCFPKGGAVLAAFIRLPDGTEYTPDVDGCNYESDAICGYVLHMAPGGTVAFHDGVAGTLYPDWGGEWLGPEGQLQQFLRDITAEVHQR